MAEEPQPMTLSDPSRPDPHALLSDTRMAMEEIAAKLLFIKTQSTSKSDLRDLLTLSSLHFLTLRQVNRAILLEEDRVKSETDGAKAPVDFASLQLHNLMYEKDHYLKAIKTCRDFKSKYPEIDLVPEEEFFTNAPPEIRASALSDDGAHDLMLKRLKYELLQRKELCNLRERLEQKKKGLLDTIATKKKFLSSLPSHLKSLKKASLPVQQQLGVPHSKKLKQQRAAELLPPPLYILYSQLVSQKEAFGEKIELDIVGSVKDAQTFAMRQANKDQGLSANTESNKIEDDTPDDEDDGQRRRKRPRKLLNKDTSDHVGLYQSHPLNVILHIHDDEKCEKNSKLATLRFEYLVKLNVVCVGIEGAQEGPESNILCNLFPNDTGMQLPHQMAKLYSGDNIAFDEKRISRPFKWVQHLAGMDFLPEISPLIPCESSNSESLKGASILSGLSLYRHQNRVETLLQRIRSRKKAQVALQTQLDSLTKLRWPALACDNVPWALHSPMCTLQQFSAAGETEQGPGSSLTVVAHDEGRNAIAMGMQRRSATPKDEVETSREDGELPSSMIAPVTFSDLKLALPLSSIDLERSRSLALYSKGITPRKGRSSTIGKHEDDLDLILESDSDNEQQHLQVGNYDAIIACNKPIVEPWKDFGVQEFNLTLSRTNKEWTLKLQTKIKISMEYPLRPPLFSLSLLNDFPKTNTDQHARNILQCYNELRAMESEINLHILKILPEDHENHTLAHQVLCLAMLFDFHFDQLQAHQVTLKNSSIVDVGLGKPVTGKIVARSFRGRDRRKMLSWKDMECSQGYPY